MTRRLSHRRRVSSLPARSASRCRAATRRAAARARSSSSRQDGTLKCVAVDVQDGAHALRHRWRQRRHRRRQVRLGDPVRPGHDDERQRHLRRHRRHRRRDMPHAGAGQGVRRRRDHQLQRQHEEHGRRRCTSSSTTRSRCSAGGAPIASVRPRHRRRQLRLPGLHAARRSGSSSSSPAAATPTMTPTAPAIRASRQAIRIRVDAYAVPKTDSDAWSFDITHRRRLHREVLHDAAPPPNLLVANETMPASGVTLIKDGADAMAKYFNATLTAVDSR